MGWQQNRTRNGHGTLALAAPILLIGLGAAAVALTSGVGSRDEERAAVAGKGAKKLRLRVLPQTQRVAPGESTSFELRIKRGGRRKVRLRIVGPLPYGLAVSLPRSTRKKRARLRIGTAGVRGGGYRLRVQARMGRRRAIAAANLVIHLPAAPGSGGAAPFKISGDLEGELSPGRSRGLDLVLTNPGEEEIAITRIDVSLERIDAPNADDAHPCGPADFLVEQFSGAYGFRVGPSSTVSLSDLGFPPEAWPRVTMLNRPVNQDGCKHATLGFSYTGTSSGGTP